MRITSLLAAALLTGVVSFAQGADKVPDVLNFKMNSLAGQPVELSKYQGKVLLVVNVASECGLTPQYEGLQALHRKYSGQGLAVLGFPANEFGAQEPGTNSAIAQFCKSNYGVEFDMFAKVVVDGAGQCGLYKYLTSKETSPYPGPITWNFEKFLIGRDGKIVARFEPNTEPTDEAVLKAIETELAKK
jgi:glutathione peroxidase